MSFLKESNVKSLDFARKKNSELIELRRKVHNLTAQYNKQAKDFTLYMNKYKDLVLTLERLEDEGAIVITEEAATRLKDVIRGQGKA